jgi:hypothetical protein
MGPTQFFIPSNFVGMLSDFCSGTHRYTVTVPFFQSIKNIVKYVTIIRHNTKHRHIFLQESTEHQRREKPKSTFSSVSFIP